MVESCGNSKINGPGKKKALYLIFDMLIVSNAERPESTLPLLVVYRRYDHFLNVNAAMLPAGLFHFTADCIDLQGNRFTLPPIRLK